MTFRWALIPILILASLNAGYAQDSTSSLATTGTPMPQKIPMEMMPGPWIW